jgi:TRAP-type mannitol/chloroaromatic compound transport system permease small subunit
MLNLIEKIFDYVDTISAKTNKKASLLVLVIMVCASYEVVARYVFNRPTNWVWPVNRQLFCIFTLLGGIFTMSRNGHIRVEVLYDYFPTWAKKLVRFLSILCMFLFLGVLIWQSSWMGWNSFLMKETNPGSFRILPLYPIKMLVPVLSFLFLLQGLSVYYRRKNKKKKPDT